MAVLGALLAALLPLLAALGALLAALGALLAALGALLGRSWATLGRSWAALGLSWGALGRSWGGLKATYKNDRKIDAQKDRFGSQLGELLGGLGGPFSLRPPMRVCKKRLWTKNEKKSKKRSEKDPN